MKINEVVLSEKPETSQRFPLSPDAQRALSQNPAPGVGTQPKTAAPKKAPAAGNVPPQPTLNGKPSTGPKGQAWLQKYGATHNPDGTPKTASDPSLDPYDPYKDPNVQMQPKSAADSAELDRMKQLAIGGNQPPVAAAPAPAPAPETPSTGNAASAMASRSSPSTTPEPNTNALGVTAQAPGGGYGNFTGGSQQGQATQPRDASTVPDAARGVATSPEVSPDTGLSTKPGEVKTGTGGTTNITTASQDEYAWRAKNPNWNMTGAQYPGPGNWDPRTGRSKQAQAQADANAAAVKGFFNKLNPFGKKDQPAAAPQQGQGTQPAPVTGPNPPGGGYGRFQESELSDIKKLSGLK